MIQITESHFHFQASLVFSLAENFNHNKKALIGMGLRARDD
ncbi:hypothetical protein HMPREF0539_2298 [Lacticaseibacillus rhamnosus LMS2-1]|uniref:Uncharacterized protein n=1 Tax=Lacticaseibacillus rhamnosus (strain LMS2-1) TaxID=525361 RepID=C2JZG3_LACRM|nr:conserved hypothetical protein [Lacticaseibacillus rhamnosus ATCC 8530]EEN79511.1 hypothetical protein HMPREF0539_2298 [Lacticaseibacillus rhamnosus LMS2-1]